MTATARENGLKHDWFVDERSDPEKATIAAARYLKTLSKMFDGDWNLVLAAYNGGPGRVQRAMKRSGKQDFWEITGSSRFLPKETREYVPLILAAMIVAKNPVQGDSIAWKVHQKYSDGMISDWVGAPGTPAPAPVTKLVPADK